MAYISVVSKTSSSVNLCVAGLQPEWARGDRTVNWYLGENGTPTESAYAKKQTVILEDTISADKTKGGYVTFSGLKANHTYGVLCTIYFGSENLAQETGSVKTDAEDSADTVGLTSINLGTVDSSKNIGFSLDKMKVLRYSVVFNSSGTANFYTTGYADVYGYLSTSTEWDNISGKPTNYLKRDYGSYTDEDFLISHNVVAGTTYYVWVRGYTLPRSYSGTLHIEPPQSSSSDLWTWSDEAYNAFLSHGNTTDVPYTEWNAFVDYVYHKTWSNLDGSKMDANDKTLYAEKFNIVRQAIGGVNSFQVGTNSIRDHYNSTGSWNMKKGETVKGQYFIDLTKYLNEIE